MGRSPNYEQLGRRRPSADRSAGNQTDGLFLRVVPSRSCHRRYWSNIRPADRGPSSCRRLGDSRWVGREWAGRAADYGCRASSSIDHPVAVSRHEPRRLSTNREAGSRTGQKGHSNRADVTADSGPVRRSQERGFAAARRRRRGASSWKGVVMTDVRSRDTDEHTGSPVQNNLLQTTLHEIILYETTLYEAPRRLRPASG